MLVGILKTDNGVHSPAKLAIATAGQIVKVGADAQGVDAIEGYDLEAKIKKILEQHHADHQTRERGKLAEHGDERLSHDIHDGTSERADAALADIVDAAKGTRFESQFSDENTQKTIRAVVGTWFSTSADIERDWHAKGHVIGDDCKATPREDFDPKNEHVVAWHAARHG